MKCKGFDDLKMQDNASLSFDSMLNCNSVFISLKAQCIFLRKSMKGKYCHQTTLAYLSPNRITVKLVTMHHAAFNLDY